MKSKEIKRKSVESSNIKSIGHDGDVLEIEFKNGRIYQYSPVTKQQYDDFISAENIGKYFHTNFRENDKLETKIIK